MEVLVPRSASVDTWRAGLLITSGEGWNSVTFQVLNKHMWLVATILNNTYIDGCHRKTRSEKGRLVL